MRRLCQAHGAITALFPTLQNKQWWCEGCQEMNLHLRQRFSQLQMKEMQLLDAHQLVPDSQPQHHPLAGNSCRYDGKWWVHHIRDISEENEDVQIQFIHPHGPARSLAGKRGHLLCTTSMCPMSGRCSKHNNGRQYYLDKKDNVCIIHLA